MYHLRSVVISVCLTQTTSHDAQGFLVANTHVLFNTKRGDIKLGQLRVILNELVAAAAAAAAGGAGAEAEAATSVPTESGGATGVHRTGADAGEEGEEDEEDSGRRGRAPRLGSTAAHLPCVFAGDFNTAPGSGLYRYLRSGRLELAAEDRRELSGEGAGWTAAAGCKGGGCWSAWEQAVWLMQCRRVRCPPSRFPDTFQHPCPSHTATDYAALPSLTHTHRPGGGLRLRFTTAGHPQRPPPAAGAMGAPSPAPAAAPGAAAAATGSAG